MPTVRELAREYDEILVPRMMRHRRRGGLGGAGDTTAPTLTLPLGLPLGDTSGYLGVTTNEGNGTLYYVVTTSATPPSAAQVKAGQNDGGTAAVYAGNQVISSTGAKEATATGLSSATAYYAYFMHEDALGNQSNVSAATVFTTLTTGTSDTSFDDLMAAASVAPSNLRKGYIARFIGAVYVAGVWAKRDAIWVWGAHDAQFGRLNWKNPSLFACSEVNSPTFTTDRGYAGNGTTSYIDTGWDPANNGSKWLQNDAQIDVYVRTSMGGTGGFGGRTGFANTIRNAGCRINNSGSEISGMSGTLPYFAFGRRIINTTVTVGVDGVQQNSGAQNSGALSSVDFALGAVAGSFTTGQGFAGSVGGYLDDTENAAWYAAIHDLAVALGADT